MAKRGYTCQCGWRLGRKSLTRKHYAEKKVEHAEKCEPLRRELKQSGKVVLEPIQSDEEIIAPDPYTGTTGYIGPQ